MVWDIRCNRRDGYYKPVNVIHNAHTTQRTQQQTAKRNRRRNSSKAKLSVSQQYRPLALDARAVPSGGQKKGIIVLLGAVIHCFFE